MSKKNSPLSTLPTGDSLSAEEQAFFDSAGESDVSGGEASTNPSVDDDAEGATDLAPTDDAEVGSSDTGEPAEPARQKMVPHAALHEERLRSKEFRDRAEKAEEERTKLMARVNELFDRQMAAQQAPAAQTTQQETAPPDPNEDPIAYLTWVSQKLASKQEETERFIADQRAQSEQSAVLGSLQKEAIAAEGQFRAEHPDYDQASQFMQNSRMNEMRAMGYTDGQARDILGREAISIAAHAKQNNLNPAKVIYDMAMARGYQTGSADAGTQASGTVDEAQAGTAEQQLERVAAGQRQSRTLSQSRGSAPTQMTAQRLIEMEDAEFEAFRSKNPKEFRSLMGN